MKFLRILSWAVFLGASWTWCIGMYLPVLLVRDYGVWAWVVFAIPNVLGAAAMAWVLPDARASRQFVQDHPLACHWFSIVTLAFHVFFLQWIISHFLRLDWEMDTIAFIVLLIVSLLFTAGMWTALGLAVIASAGAAVWLFVNRAIPNLPPHVAPDTDLIWTALVCIFGFGLCPYLDLTFHEARQATGPAAGKAAFAIGFGALFFSMIVFSLCYSGWLERSNIPDYIAIALGNHLLFQTGLKLILHTRAIKTKCRWHGWMIVLAISIAAAAMGRFSATNSHAYHGLSLFELLYRLFLSFYGLIFPAYVWICIFGKNRPIIFATAVLLAAPFYWMGFIERQMIYLLPGVAIVFCARYLKPPPKHFFIIHNS